MKGLVLIASWNSHHHWPVDHIRSTSRCWNHSLSGRYQDGAVTRNGDGSARHPHHRFAAAIVYLGAAGARNRYRSPFGGNCGRVEQSKTGLRFRN